MVQRTSRTPNGEPRRFFEEVLLLDTDDCIVWPYASDGHGYGKLWVDGVLVKVHRLALERSERPPKAGEVARHGPCRNPACFNPKHLSWGSVAENMRDKERDGTRLLGSRNHRAKFDEDDVREIRRLSDQGVLGVTLAERYGVSKSVISNVINRRRWAHVDPVEPNLVP